MAIECSPDKRPRSAPTTNSAAARVSCGSIDVDADDVSHRSTAAPIAGDDETKGMVWNQHAVHVVCDLNWPARKLWGDLGEGDDRSVSVRAGDADRKMNLFGGLCRINCAGSDEHIPQQGPRPFILLFAAAGHEADALGERRQCGNACGGNHARRLAGALHEKSGRRRDRFDQGHGIETVRFQ
jgi:hypothetical protein